MHHFDLVFVTADRAAARALAEAIRAALPDIAVIERTVPPDRHRVRALRIRVYQDSSFVADVATLLDIAIPLLAEFDSSGCWRLEQTK